MPNNTIDVTCTLSVIHSNVDYTPVERSELGEIGLSTDGKG